MQSHPCYLSLHLFLYTFSRSYTDSLIYLRLVHVPLHVIAVLLMVVTLMVLLMAVVVEFRENIKSSLQKSFSSISWEKLFRCMFGCNPITSRQTN